MMTSSTLRGSVARNAILRSCILLLLAGGSGLVEAASIGFRSIAAPVTEGSVVEVVIYGTGFADGTDGGDFRLSWSGNLEFVGLSISDPPWDLSAYDDSNVAFNLIDYVDVFSLTETPGIGGIDFDIATLTLQAVGTGEAAIYLEESFVGWSLAGEGLFVSTTNFRYDVAEFEIVPTVVPLPGAAWLLASGLLGLSGWSRRVQPAQVGFTTPG